MMDQATHRDRITSASGVVLLHALLAYALISGLAFRGAETQGDRLKLFDIVEAPPPPLEEPAPPNPPGSAAKDEAAPPNLEARPVALVAPPPRLQRDPPPVTTAPQQGTGQDSSAGASDEAGPGSGSGGEGAGAGGGGSGAGAGVARPARLIRGRIANGDYPRAALRARVGGTVLAHLSVGVNGRVTQCIVARSSGDAALDETTCRLVLRRFRFEPARDAAGRPVSSRVGWRQDWWLESRLPSADTRHSGPDPAD